MIDDLWYKNAIFYCLHVGTFMDANGDGTGDFEGLMRRLDYLAGIGITALWLAPFHPSPYRDDGYDVQDYYAVDPRYGTLGDFVEFTQQARIRGIRVIIDLVINHTSDQHPWFRAARSDPKSKYRDYYCWSKKKPPGANKGMVFPGVQTSTWSWDKEARAYYYHRFYDFQPDLNIDNPAVEEEIRKIMGFWLELGVSGFRLDAVPFIIESTPGRGPKEMHFEYLRELHDFLQWRSGDGILLAEANILPPENQKYFGPEGDRLHMILNFFVNQHLVYALASGDCRPLAQALRSTHRHAETAQWGNFLRTHDEADLGRLTPKQRKEVYKVFGPEESMQLYDRGIRRRLAPMLGGDPRRIALAYSLLFTLPGTPVIRYGDEIGMGDDLSLPERNAVRTPMQWTGDTHGGFSTAEKTILPVICDGPFGYQRVNVAEQRRQPDSLLNCTERLIRMRKECPELGWGECQLLPTGTKQVLATLSTWRKNSVLAVHNFSDQ
ncbi:MAG TPA: alpha-amylase family protein, partial [Polyangia bacterium]|nr:alpha-amylase family protein [Polyangia bacterium]